MNDSCIVTFTSRRVAEMLDDGGSKRWLLNPKRASSSRYLVRAFNAAGPFVEKDDSRHHREAFFIAPVSGVESAGENRYIICFRQFALISVLTCGLDLKTQFGIPPWTISESTRMI